MSFRDFLNQQQEQELNPDKWFFDIFAILKQIQNQTFTAEEVTEINKIAKWSNHPELVVDSETECAVYIWKLFTSHVTELGKSGRLKALLEHYSKEDPDSDLSETIS